MSLIRRCIQTAFVAIINLLIGSYILLTGYPSWMIELGFESLAFALIFLVLGVALSVKVLLIILRIIDERRVAVSGKQSV